MAFGLCKPGMGAAVSWEEEGHRRGSVWPREEDGAAG